MEEKKYTLDDLVQVIRILRGENGCPWDRVQTHASIRQDMLEEAYEAADAIDKGNMENLCEELGDVLMQVVFHAEIEAEKGGFTMDNSCLEMKDSSFIMKIQYKVTEHIIAKDFGGKKDLTDPSYRMMLTCATDCPMRAVIISSGGSMSDGVAAGLLHMANGHFLKVLAAMLRK